MKIRQDIIDQIKGRIDIVEVLDDFLTLKRVGQSYRALSPFTDEKTPSFYVSPSKGIFKDFSSGKGGDAIAFIMELEGLSYLEAIKYLGKKYGIEIEEEAQTDEEIAQQNERESLYIALSFANEYYQNLLWHHTDGKAIGHSYFKERGFTDQIIKEFELGYSLDIWDGLMKEALDKGFKQEVLEKAGLIIAKEDKRYDRFRGRVIFPIHNITGKPIAFGARTLVSDKKQPKYINSPETEIYHKSKVLYGIHQAKQAIRQADNCFLVEGYTDVISMHMAGVKNVVASSGTSLTDEQIKLINRYTRNITVLFDGDAAGIRASIRGVDMILETGMNVKVVVFPDGEDPDSYARKSGSAQFQEYLQKESQDFIRFKISGYAKEGVGDPVKKAETIRNIVESISKIPDAIQRAVYIQESSKLLDIDESILIAEQNKILIKKHKEQRREKSSQQVEEEALLDKLAQADEEQAALAEVDALMWQEKESVRILLTYGTNEVEDDVKLSQYMLHELEEISFNTPIYSEILTTIKEHLKKGVWIDVDYFLNHGSEEVKQEVIDLTTEKFDISENWYEMYKIHVAREPEKIDDVAFTNIHRLKWRFIQKKIDSYLAQLKQESDPDKQISLQKIIKSYKTTEMEIASVLGNVVSR
ncbi:DNA primase [Fulvivirgaceae bacterium BMA12]|uniref:DNA primase n=1 Tax=Agaribacillus aureus TaxID=3051825 RepID=A0ABT8L286_9BACT|nr:DNA primase [Fulvivirgaceae bacterium BMA12]